MKTQGIAVLMVLVASGSEAASPGGWQVNIQPEKVTEGWEPWRPEAEHKVWAERQVEGGTVAVMPFETGEGSCGNAMGKYVSERYPSLTVERREEGALRFRYSKGAFRGEAVCTMAGESGMIAVATGRVEAFERHRAELMKEARAAVAGVGRRYVSWRDQEAGIFSLRVPEGWKVEGGVQRGRTIWARLWSPDGAIGVFFNDPDLIPCLRREGAKELGMAEYKEGQVYSGGGLRLMMAPYLAGVEFAAKYVELRLTEVASLVNVRMVEKRERRDLSRMRGNVGAQGSYGEVWFEGSGGEVKGYAMGITKEWPMGMWVGEVHGYTAPAGRVEEALGVLLRSLQTMQVRSDFQGQAASGQ